MHLVFTYIRIIFIIMVYYLVGTLSIILIKEKGTFVILFSNVKNSMDDDFNKDFRKMVSDLLEQGDEKMKHKMYQLVSLVLV